MTPADEIDEMQWHTAPEQHHNRHHQHQTEGTEPFPSVGRTATVSDAEKTDRPQHLQIPTGSTMPVDPSFLSPTDSNREQAMRLNDDLMLLKAERAVSRESEENALRRSQSGIRGGEDIKEDVFNQPIATNTIPAAIDPLNKPNKLHAALLSIRKVPRIVRYIIWAASLTPALLIPVLLGELHPAYENVTVGGAGGVQLLWFGVWLLVLWLSLWAARMVTAILPWTMYFFAYAIGSGNPRKYRDIGRHLEIHAALFLWMLAVFISFLPLVTNHKVPAEGDEPYPYVTWIDIVYKLIISFFVLALLNLIEKILIQWIATSFHMRTYSTRIAENKQNIAYLVHLWEHSKDRIVSAASVMGNTASGSGSKTPMASFQATFQDNAQDAVRKIGDVANRVAADFTGQQARLSNHPRKMVTELLRNTSTAQLLARRLFRTYSAGGDLLRPHDLRPAFPSDEDAEAAFGIFDRDLNGDVSIEELEAFCDEVHREKKAIAASLKDLDSVISKLDRVFFIIILVICIIVLICIISSAAASALSSVVPVVLGLAWVLQATAQEFLQSMIFVFVKHPFDVGDRITVYGNTGATMTGDDYYVTEISLLYTEFKKMEGHIVQAPNSLLNTLFILNHRRSGSLADVFALTIKFGTPSSVIKELEARMTEFVLANPRDYTSKILTELRTFEDSYSMQLNFICFHKTSYQNELLRLVRHNKFAIELMNHQVELGIEQPRRQVQVSGKQFPVYNTTVEPPSYEETRPTVDPSILQATRRRANSSTVQGHHDHFQDVFVARKPSVTHYRAPPPRINEESEEAMASGANLAKTESTGSARQTSHSNRSHLFSRARARSSTDRRERDDMV